MASDLAAPSRGISSEAEDGGNGRINALHSPEAEDAPTKHGQPGRTSSDTGTDTGSDSDSDTGQPVNKPSQSNTPSTPSSEAPENPPSKPTSSRPNPSPTPSRTPAKSRQVTVTCSGSGGLLPANVQTIVTFLIAHGYTDLAAAGIAGNMYRESLGNPESVGSGGGGLIGFTPLPAGYVTGNPAADLRTQLNAVLTYNQQWAQYIPALNAATSATQAADIYMNDFERPGIPAASEREAAAVAVAAACHL